MVTAPELASRLSIDPKRLRAWLRKQAARGHPLLASHEHYGRWKFSEAEADQLASDYLAPPTKRANTSSRPRARPAASTNRRRPSSRRARAAETRPLSDNPGHRVVEDWMGRQVLTLEDLLRPGLAVVVVGINPAMVSVAAGHYYQGHAGQALFRRLRRVGLLPDGAGFEDDRAFAAGVGFTDAVKRPTASADEVTSEELDYGRNPLAAKLRRARPDLLIFSFKGSATALLGPFPGFGFVGLEFAGAEVFVMPRPWEKASLAEPELEALATRVRTGG